MKKKILEFKTVSPLFEMERDGKKYFTERLIDAKDSRFRALSQWKHEYDWLIRIVNPVTGESFVRHIFNVGRMLVYDWRYYDPAYRCHHRAFQNWLIIEWDLRKVEEE
jgi:hypothetical protein